MKCPNCKFVSSNKRDVCPRCQYDLRPQKIALGLPVSDPHASVEKLIAIAEQVEQKTQAQQPIQLHDQITSSPNNTTENTLTSNTKASSSWLSRLIGKTKAPTKEPQTDEQEKITEAFSSIDQTTKQVETVTQEIAKEVFSPKNQQPPQKTQPKDFSSLLQKRALNQNEQNTTLQPSALESSTNYTGPMIRDSIDPSNQNTLNCNQSENDHSLSVANLASQAVVANAILKDFNEIDTEDEELSDQDLLLNLESLIDSESDTLDNPEQYSSGQNDPIHNDYLHNDYLQNTRQPDILDFADDDRLLEEQLDAMIDDLVVGVEAVPTNIKSAVQIQKEVPFDSFLIDDDIEISFEIDLEEPVINTQTQAASKAATSPTTNTINAATINTTTIDNQSGEERALESLLSAFDAITEGTSQISLSAQTSNDDSEDKDVIQILTSNLAQAQKDTLLSTNKDAATKQEEQATKSYLPELPTQVLITELMELVVEAYNINHLELSDLIHSRIKAKQDQTKVIEEAIPTQSAPSIEEAIPAQELDPLKELEDELSKELNSLMSEGATFFAETQEAMPQEILSQETTEQEITELEQITQPETHIEPMSIDQVSSHEDTHEEIDALASLEAELNAELAALADEGSTWLGSYSSSTLPTATVNIEISASDDLPTNEPQLEANTGILDISHPQQAIPLEDAVNTGIFLLSDMERIIAQTTQPDLQQPDLQQPDFPLSDPHQSNSCDSFEDEMLALNAECAMLETSLEQASITGEAQEEEDESATLNSDNSLQESQPDATSEFNTENIPEATPLGAATNTGIFLMSDMQRAINEMAAIDESTEPISDTSIRNTIEDPKEDSALMLNALWEETYDALSNKWTSSNAASHNLNDADVSFELSSADLIKLTQNDTLDMLFDVVDDDLVSPNKQKMLLSAENVKRKSEQVQIDSSDIQNAFVKYEKEERELQKEKKRLEEAKTQNESVESKGAQTTQIIPATRWRRIGSWAFDFMINVTVGFVVYSILKLPSEIQTKLTMLEALTIEEMLPHTFPCIAYMIGTWVIMGAVLYWLHGQTIGQGLFGIMVVTSNKQEVSLKQALLYAISQSATLLSLGLGLLPSLTRSKRLLHDRIADVWVIKADPYEPLYR